MQAFLSSQKRLRHSSFLKKGFSFFELFGSSVLKINPLQVLKKLKEMTLSFSRFTRVATILSSPQFDSKVTERGTASSHNPTSVPSAVRVSESQTSRPQLLILWHETMTCSRRKMGNDRAEFYSVPFGSGTQSGPDTFSLALHPLQFWSWFDAEGGFFQDDME